MTTSEFLSKPYANEDQMTAHFVLWVNNNYPALRGMFTHIPNEISGGSKIVPGRFKFVGNRKIPMTEGDMQRIKMKALGVLPGVPDFCFVYPVLRFLELKMPNGVVSPDQKKLHDLWETNGIFIDVVWSKQECVDWVVRYYGNPIS